jgi:hypothetical protein
MFNFLKSSKSDYIVPSETPYNVTELKKDSNDGYKIGINNDNNVTLTLNHGANNITMTMNAEAVYKLIDLLQAALPEIHDEVEE